MHRTGYDAQMSNLIGKADLIERQARQLREQFPELSVTMTLEELPDAGGELIDVMRNSRIIRTAEKLGKSIDEMRVRYKRDLERDPGMDADMQTGVLADHVYLVNHALHGARTFHVSDNLTEKLALTEANIACENIHLPFRACQFTFESPLAVKLFRNILTPERDWRSASAMTSIDSSISVIALMGDEHPDGHRVLGLGCYEVKHDGRARSPIRALFSRELRLTPGEDLEAALRTDWAKDHPDEADPGSKINFKTSDLAYDEDDSLFYQDGIGFYRLVMNAALYAMAMPEDRVSHEDPQSEYLAQFEGAGKKVRRKAEVLKKTITPRPYQTLGSSVAPVSETGRKLERRIMVRGHWKQQAHGPKMSLRKLIHIEPYYKGPEDAETEFRDYLLKNDPRNMEDEPSP